MLPLKLFYICYGEILTAHTDNRSFSVECSIENGNADRKEKNVAGLCYDEARGTVM
jgi:hypothetical protein